jgi:hypothetical protein
MSTVIGSTISSSESPFHTTVNKKFDLPKMSSHTSLLDIVRGHGHVLLKDHLVRQQPSTRLSQQVPMMTSEEILSSKSKPIPILSPSHHHHIHHHLNDLDDLDDEDISSSVELKRFYDQATWRMYVLIQSARQAAPYNSHHPHLHHYTKPATTANEWTATGPQGPTFIEDEDGNDDIFDMEL